MVVTNRTNGTGWTRIVMVVMNGTGWTRTVMAVFNEVPCCKRMELIELELWWL